MYNSSTWLRKFNAKNVHKNKKGSSVAVSYLFNVHPTDFIFVRIQCTLERSVICEYSFLSNVQKKLYIFRKKFCTRISVRWRKDGNSARRLLLWMQSDWRWCSFCCCRKWLIIFMMPLKLMVALLLFEHFVHVHLSQSTHLIEINLTWLGILTKKLPRLFGQSKSWY